MNGQFELFCKLELQRITFLSTHLFVFRVFDSDDSGVLGRVKFLGGLLETHVRCYNHYYSYCLGLPFFWYYRRVVLWSCLFLGSCFSSTLWSIESGSSVFCFTLDSFVIDTGIFITWHNAALGQFISWRFWFPIYWHFIALLSLPCYYWNRESFIIRLVNFMLVCFFLSCVAIF